MDLVRDKSNVTTKRVNSIDLVRAKSNVTNLLDFS